MKNTNSKISYIKFAISVIIIFILFFIVSFFYEDNKEKQIFIKEIEKSSIIDSNDLYSIDVNYPRFENDNLNKIITNYVYSYVKEFKDSDKKVKTLNIDYELYNIDNYINIVFFINNSLDKQEYHNILLNVKENKLAYITDIYDKNYLKDEILNLVYHKYKNDIYNTIKEANINNYTYILSDNSINVYFYNMDFNNIKYTPNVKINFNDEKTVFDDLQYQEGTKYIAFTFDDGPSEYTLDILKTLELNQASATFFMLGNKMKYSSDIVLEVYNSNSEVASHSYSHKYLTKISDEELYEELNSPQIIFNEITGSDILYLRPPYGDYNNKILNASFYPLILWNIDPRDWLLKDSDRIYNNVITNACDGCIVLLHDTYEETVEAVKKLIPNLKEMGYEIVSVSDLFKIKDITVNSGDVINNIKK